MLARCRKRSAALPPAPHMLMLTECCCLQEWRKSGSSPSWPSTSAAGSSGPVDSVFSVEMAGRGGPGSSCPNLETWLVLEHCDGGNVGDVVGKRLRGGQAEHVTLVRGLHGMAGASWR